MLDIDGVRVMPFKHQQFLSTPLSLCVSPVTPSPQITLSTPPCPPISSGSYKMPEAPSVLREGGNMGLGGYLVADRTHGDEKEVETCM